MAVRLFKLRDVPEDEVAEIRALLDEHEIPFYETHAGGWGIGTPAIWLYDKSLLLKAKALIEAYQERRYESARTEYDALKREGNLPTFMGRFSAHPVLVIIFILAILFILYASLSPFLNFGS